MNLIRDGCQVLDFGIVNGEGNGGQGKPLKSRLKNQ